MANWANNKCGNCGFETEVPLEKLTCREETCGKVGCGRCVRKFPEPALPICDTCIRSKVSQALAGKRPR